METEMFNAYIQYPATHKPQTNLNDVLKFGSV